jgi:pimeloyl-ACP methyl ester carboxylesterase
MAFSKQKVIATVLGQGGRVFPRLAGRVAFELFCRTDDPNKPGNGERAAIERAKPIMIDARQHRLKISTGCVVAYQFHANAAVRHQGKILIVHGWRSRTDFMAQMAAGLNASGWDVVGLDLPGHGRSTGRTLNVKRGVEAIQAASTWLGPFDVAIGHSFGGVVVVNAAVGGIAGIVPVPFGQLAIIASPNSMPEMFKGVGHYFGLRKSAQAAMENRILKVAGHPVSDFVLSEQLKRFDGEVLVLHAPDDREVAYAGALEMAKAGDHVRHIPFQGLGHRRIIADSGVIDALVAFAGRSDIAVAA